MGIREAEIQGRHARGGDPGAPCCSSSPHLETQNGGPNPLDLVFPSEAGTPARSEEHPAPAFQARA